MHIYAKVHQKQGAAQQTNRSKASLSRQKHPAAVIQRTRNNPRSLSSREVLHLQRTVGNRAVRKFLVSRSQGHTDAFTLKPTIQAKLAVGPANDKYEQEADRVARQVVQRIEISPSQSASHPVQRQDVSDKEELHMKSEEGFLQRQVLEEEEEEELQMKFERGFNYRQSTDEDDELQMKPAVQPWTSGRERAVTQELEETIQKPRGQGKPLPGAVLGSMEQAFESDFSGVRVHTDHSSDQLNRSLNARAFTTGEDIFFRQGSYDPGSSHGRQLLAHELTHIIQQNGGKIRCEQNGTISATDQPFELKEEYDIRQKSNELTHNNGILRFEYVQRKMSFKPEDLKGKVSKKAKAKALLGKRSTFSNIKKYLGQYWVSHETMEEVFFLQVLKGLAETWLKKHGGKSSETSASLNLMLVEIKEELPKAEKQVGYLKDISKGKFEYLSDLGKKLAAPAAKYLTIFAADPARAEQVNIDPTYKPPDQRIAEQVNIIKEYGLTDAELSAIKIFSLDDYKSINPGLAKSVDWFKYMITEADKGRGIVGTSRGKDISPEGVKIALKEGRRHGKIAKQGLEKLPDVTEVGYRGVGVDKDDLKNDYQKGKTISTPAFKSISLNEKEAQKWATKGMEIKGIGVFMKIHVTKGKKISMLSALPSEDEVLLMPNAILKIEKLEPRSGEKNIYDVLVRQVS